MNFKALTLAALLGVATPAIADIATNTAAVAEEFSPMGTYQDSTWAITLEWESDPVSELDTFNYYGRNKRTGNSIKLYDATTSGSRARRIYTWYNGRTRYQIAWRPNDPNIIRLQVFNSNGRQILNRLLRR